jgi:hypothetical protein
MSTPLLEKKSKRPKPKKRRQKTFRFCQSLFLINGFFDGEDLVSDAGHRFPATLAPKSSLAPGDRGGIVCYLKSLKSDQGYSSSLEVVRLQRENDPHVRDLSDGGFVAGQVTESTPQGCLVRVTPHPRHKSSPFEVWVAHPRSRLYRVGSLVCFKVEIDDDGQARSIGHYHPPVKWWTTKPESDRTKPAPPIKKSKESDSSAIACHNK